MKVLFNNSLFFHQRYGGVTRCSVYLAKKLIEKKIDINILAPIFKNIYLREISDLYKFGFYIKRYPRIKIVEYFNNKIITNKSKKNKSSIIHDGYFSSSTLELKNKTKILTIHDLIHEKLPHLYSENRIEIRRKIISNTDYFICVSEKTKEDFIDFYKIPENKIKVIHHGSDHLPHYENNKDQENLQLDKPFILFVGTRAKYKNFDLLLKSYFNSNKIKKDFDLICFGGGNFTSKEINLFKKLKLINKIKLVSGDDYVLKKLYQNAFIFVFPSYYEGFGLPLLEAMQMGCPILASDISVFKEICGNSIKYFKSEDFEHLTYNLEELLYSSSQTEDLIKKGYEHVKKYTWSKCADQVINVYNNFYSL